VRRGALFLAVALAAPCLAQAPAEDRRLRADPVAEAQQRISVLVREVDAAEQAVRRADEEARESASRLATAKKRNDGATQALKSAQERAAQVRKAYQAEAEGLERLRRQGK
jgi:hypothetical protein